MRENALLLIGAVAICAFVLTFTPVTFSEAVGGPKHFTGELHGNTYFDYDVQFQSDKFAEFKVDFRPKYQKERNEVDCSNFQIKLYGENGKWMMTNGGTFSYEEDKTNGKEVIRCTSSLGYTLRKHRNETFKIMVVNNNPWLATYTIDTN